VIAERRPLRQELGEQFSGTGVAVIVQMDIVLKEW
jgi:hypothetical protein